jgi:uncharacterized cupredoxin-like copper-binding protein
MNRLAIAVALAGILTILAACTGGGEETTGTRTVPVRMFDDMRYDPAEFDVFAGETIVFDVTNSGEVPHEFFLADLAGHEEHAAEMREGGHADDAHGTPDGLNLEAGETATLEYTFSEAGDLLVGCHQPGHYEAGMVAPITVHPGGGSN